MQKVRVTPIPPPRVTVRTSTQLLTKLLQKQIRKHRSSRLTYLLLAPDKSPEVDLGAILQALYDRSANRLITIRNLAQKGVRFWR